jgi:hypothetical protein
MNPWTFTFILCNEFKYDGSDRSVTRIRGIKLKNQIVVLLATVLVCSCAGNAPFREDVQLPEEKIAALAGQIEDAVLDINPEEIPAIEYGKNGEDVAERNLMNAIAGTDEIRKRIPALSDLNMDNEIVLAAVRGRILRRPAVKELEQNGCIGENRRGYLQYLGGKWCKGDRHYRDRASYIVLSDNRDRRVIFEQLIEANGLHASARDRIREIFAEQIYQKAWAGTPLQMPDGTWERR